MDVKLVMVKGAGKKKDFPLILPVTVIGRSEECSLRVPLVDVSRKHCQLTLSGAKLTVKDLGSANGTYVNNERVEEAPLKAGDRVTIGPVAFVVQIDGMPRKIQEPAGAKPAAAAPAPSAAAEPEVVEMEADEADEQEPKEEEIEAIQLEADRGGQDPISALEALASESQKQSKKGDNPKKK